MRVDVGKARVVIGGRRCGGGGAEGCGMAMLVSVVGALVIIQCSVLVVRGGCAVDVVVWVVACIRW